MVIILVRDFMLRLISSIKEVAVTTLAVLLIILLATSSALAQSILTTDIAPQSGTLEDLFIFTVTIEGSQTGSAPLLSGGDDFELQLIGPQTRLSIINGVVNSKISYVYHLTPKRVGVGVGGFFFDSSRSARATARLCRACISSGFTSSALV